MHYFMKRLNVQLIFGEYELRMNNADDPAIGTIQEGSSNSDFDSYDLSGIKLAASGAAPLAKSVLDKMLNAFSGLVSEGYGMTECTMGATSNPPERSKIRRGSVGIPVFDTECKVVDLETGEPIGGETPAEAPAN